MILINDNWEQVNDFQDVSRIIREYYNYELADKLDELTYEYFDEERYDLECDLNDAHMEISSLEDEVDGLESAIELLNEEIEELREYKEMYEDLCK